MLKVREIKIKYQDDNIDNLKEAILKKLKLTKDKNRNKNKDKDKYRDKDKDSFNDDIHNGTKFQ